MMAAEVLKLDDFPEKRPNSRFTIPLRSSVENYIREKMKWPESFCQYYAEKFWNHYQSQGWVLANGNPMKDWKAAFNVNWQNPKFKEDQEALSKAIAADKKQVTPEERLNQILEEYRVGRYKPNRTEVVAIYDYLKVKGLMKLPKPIIEKIVEDAGNDKEWGKMLAVKEILKKYITNGEKF